MRAPTQGQRRLSVTAARVATYRVAIDRALAGAPCPLTPAGTDFERELSRLTGMPARTIGEILGGAI